MDRSASDRFIHEIERDILSVCNQKSQESDYHFLNDEKADRLCSIIDGRFTSEPEDEVDILERMADSFISQSSNIKELNIGGF